MQAYSGAAPLTRKASAAAVPAAAPGSVRASHAALIAPTLPLLAQSWLQDRLVFGENGTFEASEARLRGDRVAIDLCAIDGAQGETPSLESFGQTRIALRYDRQGLAEARAALVAGASQGGWPIARDAQSLALLTLSERIAASAIPVLLEGPTGTGKEVYARFVHRMSPRASGPFVAVNCAAMPEAMLEALLFGHRKGAFTGAAEARDGLFRAADGGTLLLDEIGELPLALQAKLLRTLQEGEVLPLGATKPVGVDVRIVAATNRTLAHEVTERRFREDLYYRLNVFPLVLPALRDRPGDIAPLAFGMLLRHTGGPSGMGGPRWISKEALDRLETHAWPGNVRELENVIRRAILLAGDAAVITAEHVIFDQPVRAVGAGLATGFETGTAARRSPSLSDVAFQSEAQAILRALDTHGGHRGRTARSLGISERTLRYRLATMRESGFLKAGGEA